MVLEPETSAPLSPKSAIHLSCSLSNSVRSILMSSFHILLSILSGTVVAKQVSLPKFCMHSLTFIY
jgi:hypothetical protein